MLLSQRGCVVGEGVSRLWQRGTGSGGPGTGWSCSRCCGVGWWDGPGRRIKLLLTFPLGPAGPGGPPAEALVQLLKPVILQKEAVSGHTEAPWRMLPELFWLEPFHSIESSAANPEAGKPLPSVAEVYTGSRATCPAVAAQRADSPRRGAGPGQGHGLHLGAEFQTEHCQGPLGSRISQGYIPVVT